MIRCSMILDYIPNSVDNLDQFIAQRTRFYGVQICLHLPHTRAAQDDCISTLTAQDGVIHRPSKGDIVPTDSCTFRHVRHAGSCLDKFRLQVSSLISLPELGL